MGKIERIKTFHKITARTIPRLAESHLIDDPYDRTTPDKYGGECLDIGGVVEFPDELNEHLQSLELTNKVALNVSVGLLGPITKGITSVSFSSFHEEGPCDNHSHLRYNVIRVNPSPNSEYLDWRMSSFGGEDTLSDFVNQGQHITAEETVSLLGLARHLETIR